MRSLVQRQQRAPAQLQLQLLQQTRALALPGPAATRRRRNHQPADWQAHGQARRPTRCDSGWPTTWNMHVLHELPAQPVLEEQHHLGEGQQAAPFADSSTQS